MRPFTVDPMGGWRSSRVIAGIIISLFVAVQLALPVDRIIDGNDRRFGWQMYSSTELTRQFTVVTPDGDMAIDLDDYMAALRVEIEYERLLPPHLCSVVEGATMITWEGGTYTC